MGIIIPEEIFKQKKIIGSINADFLWSEFIKPIDGIPPLEHLKNIKSIATILSIYKHKVFNGKSITITSGYRSLEHHIKIYIEELHYTDKSKIPMGSYHLKGLAADFTVKDFNNKQVYELMDYIHFGGVEFPDNQNRIHIDLRGSICRFIGATNRTIAHHYKSELHEKVFCN